MSDQTRLTLREASRKDFAAPIGRTGNGESTNSADNIKAGSIQRIADALESIATSNAAIASGFTTQQFRIEYLEQQLSRTTAKLKNAKSKIQQLETELSNITKNSNNDSN